MNAKPPSDNDKNNTNGKTKNGSEKEAKPTSTPSVKKTDTSNKKNKPRRPIFKGNLTGRIALFISLFTLLLLVTGIGGGYWVWIQNQKSIKTQNQTINTLRQAIGDKASAQNLQQLEQKASQLNEHLQAQNKKLDALSQTFQHAKSLKQRDQQGWIIAETEYLMQIAQYRLNLLHDPKGAIKALTLADQQLAHLNQPRLLPVRKALIAEIQSLQDFHPPDKTTLLLELNEIMQHLVLQSPLVPGLANSTASSTAQHPIAPKTKASGFRGFIDAVWQSISQHINIQHYSHRITNLSAITTQANVLQSIYVNLENAKSAVLVDDNSVYHQSINKTEKLLKNQITSNPTKSGLLKTLDKLKAVNISPPSPALGKALSLLHKESTASDKGNARKPTS
ncbi:uroporphyrinogen-III C-methyltransferase [Acidihalobacter prosperus]